MAAVEGLRLRRECKGVEGGGKGGGRGGVGQGGDERPSSSTSDAAACDETRPPTFGKDELQHIE